MSWAPLKLQFLDLPLLYRGENRAAPKCRVTLHTRFAGREQRWDGTIVRTEGEIDPKSRMVHAIAQVDDPYGRGKGPGEHPDRPPLAVGMFVSATIHGKLFPGVIEVPRDALRGANKVLVVDSGSRLHIREVEVLRAGHETAVLRSGLEDGERICLSPLATVGEGMQVRVLSDEGSTGDR